MKMTDAKIIECVHQFSAIWDKKNPNHKNKLVVRNAWMSIASALNVPADVCEQRYMSIRNRYCKERRNFFNCTRSGAGAYEVQWPHFAACNFLEKVIISRTKSNYKASETQCIIPDQSMDIIEEDSSTQDSSISTVDEFFQQRSHDVDLTLYDIFSNRNKLAIVQTPISSKSASSRSVSPIRSLQSLTRENTYKISECYNKTPWKGKKGQIDEISGHSKCITGAFSKFDELCAKAKQPEQRSLELDDEDYAFGRTLALSLKQITSKKMRLLVKSKIMSIVSEAADDD